MKTADVNKLLQRLEAAEKENAELKAQTSLFEASVDMLNAALEKELSKTRIKAKALRKKGTEYYYNWDDYNQRWMPQDKWWMFWSGDTQLDDFMHNPPSDAELITVEILINDKP